MKSLAKSIKGHQRFLYKQFYSTSKTMMNRELVEIPTNEELEHEVSEISSDSKSIDDYVELCL